MTRKTTHPRRATSSALRATSSAAPRPYPLHTDNRSKKRKATASPSTSTSTHASSVSVVVKTEPGARSDENSRGSPVSGLSEEPSARPRKRGLAADFFNDIKNKSIYDSLKLVQTNSKDEFKKVIEGICDGMPGRVSQGKLRTHIFSEAFAEWKANYEKTLDDEDKLDDSLFRSHVGPSS